MEHGELSSTPSFTDSKEQSDRTHLIEALTELYNLLELYAPAWYTKANHDKAEGALRAVQQQRE
jgi:hypothetical protein